MSQQYGGSNVANPAPLGLAAFGVTTLVLSIYNAGIVVGFGSPVNLVVGLAVFYGGVAQLLAGMWEFKAGNTFGATVFTSYGGFWLSFAVIYIPGFGVIEGFVSAGDADKIPHAVAIFLLGWAIFTFLMLLCTLRQNVAVISLFVLLTITFVLLSIANFKSSLHKSFTKAGGYTGIVTAAIALYMAVAHLATPENTIFTFPLGKLYKSDDL